MVGIPLQLLLLKKYKTTLTTLHSKTNNLNFHLKNADLIISAIGNNKVINEDFIKDDCIVIDCGINFENGKIVGDLNYEKLRKRVKFVSPVPCGIGILSTAFFFDNYRRLLVKEF